MKKLIISAVAAFMALAPSLAFAGSSAATAPKNFAPKDIETFAKKVERTLAEKGARIALVARVGRARDDLPEGIRYTHVAYWVYSDIQTAEGKTVRGYAAYNLYQRADALDISDLITDYPADYFAGVEELEAGILIPKPKLQQQLLQAVTSDTFKKLHVSDYSVIANPNNTKYQNCTEHALNILFSTLYKTDDIKQIKANIKEYFKPQPIHLSPLEALFGPVVMKDVATSDHKGKIKTTTFTTIGEFMKSYDLLEEKIELKL